MDNWASVQDPYRYPTGYDLWKIVKQYRGVPADLSNVLSELQARFRVVNSAFVEEIGDLWQRKRLFADLRDIGYSEQDGAVSYFYRDKPIGALPDKALVSSVDASFACL